MSEIMIGYRILAYGEKPYFVAELNSSHNGHVDVAKEMIDAAKAAGCDCVKFQSWSADSLYSKSYYEKNPIAKRMVRQFALKPDDLLELSKYCREIGIDFSSTPYSKEEVDFLVDDCKAPFVKVASMDINNLPYLEYIAQKHIPIVLSTGMATIDEIDASVKTIENGGNDEICILHCVSLYPAETRYVNLNNMVTLKQRYPQHIAGYSDHTIGIEAACAAVALGAVLIEKHFTLSNQRIGWDNQMATEPEEMKSLVNSCLAVFSSLGDYERHLTDNEYKQRLKMRRSLIAARDLTAGSILRKEDIIAKRPGDGIAADKYQDIIGKRLIRDIGKDEAILYNCFDKQV